MRMRNIKALLLAAVMLLSMAACAGKEKRPAEAGDRTIVYYAASYVTAQVQPYYKEMVDAYNKTAIF